MSIRPFLFNCNCWSQRRYPDDVIIKEFSFNSNADWLMAFRCSHCGAAKVTGGPVVVGGYYTMDGSRLPIQTPAYI